MSKHTPGPWIMTDTSTSSIDIHANPYKWVASCLGTHVGVEQEQLEANARLITAAPDMYELMKEFCERVEKGEVRSKKTYAKFKDILNRIDNES